MTAASRTFAQIFDDALEPLTGKLERALGALGRAGNAGTREQPEIAKVLDGILRAERLITQAIEEIPLGDLVLDDLPESDDRLVAALSMLHEQAHGGPFKFCQAEPCRELAVPKQGPAPRVLPS